MERLFLPNVQKHAGGKAMETRWWGLADSSSLQPGQLASTRLQRLSGSVQVLLALLRGNTATGLSFWRKRNRLIIAEEIGSHRKEKLGEKSQRLLWHRPIYRLLRKQNSLCWTKWQQAQNGQKEPQGEPQSLAAFQSRRAWSISAATPPPTHHSGQVNQWDFLYSHFSPQTVWLILSKNA